MKKSDFYYQLCSIRSVLGEADMYEQDQELGPTSWDKSKEDALCLKVSSHSIYQLGRDRLPRGLEDIRGRIYGQDGWIYGYLLDGKPIYFALVERVGCICSECGVLYEPDYVETDGFCMKCHGLADE